jgi:serine/threonine-protein kinase
MYLALEPYVRRRWPHSIISWSRLVAGKWKDPLLGRDLLSGVLLGLVWATLLLTPYVIGLDAGYSPNLGASDYLIGGRFMVGAWLGEVMSSIQSTLVFFLVLFLLRVALRRAALAAIAFVLLFSYLNSFTMPNPWQPFAVCLVVYGVAVVAVVRFGLVTLAVGIWATDLIVSVPVTADPSSWWSPTTAFVYLSILAVAAFGFYTSLGGQPLWTEGIADSA